MSEINKKDFLAVKLFFRFKMLKNRVPFERSLRQPFQTCPGRHPAKQTNMASQPSKGLCNEPINLTSYSIINIIRMLGSIKPIILKNASFLFMNNLRLIGAA